MTQDSAVIDHALEPALMLIAAALQLFVSGLNWLV
jgi:hypothetical protein